jgi:hypothetical protein
MTSATAGATQRMIDAIHNLSLIMAMVPLVAIVVSIMLIKPRAARQREGDEPGTH